MCWKNVLPRWKAAGRRLHSGAEPPQFILQLQIFCGRGDELIAANNLYGGTFTQFDAILPQQGITTHFTAVNDFEAVEKAINERTRALYIETVGNPRWMPRTSNGMRRLRKNTICR